MRDFRSNPNVEVAWQLLEDFCDSDQALHKEVRVNGVIIGMGGAKAYRSVVAAAVASKLDEGIEVSIGLASEPWDRVHCRGKIRSTRR